MPVRQDARALTRRELLQGGLVAGGAVFLAACGTSGPTPAPPAASAASSASPRGGPADEGYAGVKLNGLIGQRQMPVLEIGLRLWKTATNGDALFETFATNQKQARIEHVLNTEDSYWDVLYTYDQFMVRFGDRLLVPLSERFGDTSDFIPSAIRALSTTDGVLRGLPLFHAPAVWTWNKTHFRAVGADPDNPPDTWQALFELAPKWKAEGILPSVEPWLGAGGAYAAQYFKRIYNSLGAPLLSDDRTEVRFHGPEGLEAFETIEAGFAAGFWDASSVTIPDEQAAYAQFGAGRAATAVWSETPNIPLPPEQQGVRQFPGIRPGTTGSVAATDGVGISRFSNQIDAAASYLRTAFSAPAAREAALSALHDPVARRSVISDPEVIAAQPILVAYAAQGAGETNAWAAPYDDAPAFDRAIHALATGELDAKGAQAAAVDGVRRAIAAWVQG